MYIPVKLVNPLADGGNVLAQIWLKEDGVLTVLLDKELSYSVDNRLKVNLSKQFWIRVETYEINDGLIFRGYMLTGPNTWVKLTLTFKLLSQ